MEVVEVEEWDRSLVRRRLPKIGYSRPSPQNRNGPAPLASFEDLPTEDQNSPDSPTRAAIAAELSPDSETIANALDSELLGHRSDSATPVNELPPDGLSASAATLTHVPDANISLKPASLITDKGLGFMRRKSSPIPGKQHEQLSTSRSPIGDGRRKSSWTEILFRGRTRSRSPVDSVEPDSRSHEKRKKKGVFSFLKRKSSSSKGLNQTDEQAVAESGAGKSIVVRKRPDFLQTPVDPIPKQKGSPEDRRIAWQILRLPRLSVTGPSTDETTSVTDSMHNEPIRMTSDPDSNGSDFSSKIPDPNPSIYVTKGSPVDRKIAWEIINEHMKRKSPEDEDQAPDMPVNESVDETQTQPSPPNNQYENQNQNNILLKRKLKRRSETVDSEISECQSLPEILPSSRRKNQSANNNESKAGAGDELLSDGEENSSDDKKSLMERIAFGSDDNEVTTLLSQVELLNDGEEHSVCDSSSSSHLNRLPEPLPDTCLPDSRKSSVQILSKKERQDLTITPVDRPRSITPVAVAPLEEYLRRASLQPEQAASPASRIKLSLPGDQFAACLRSKDQRKSNPQIWLDFCGKAVGSPKVRKTFQWNENEEPAVGSSQLAPQNALLLTSPLSPNDAFTPSGTPLTPVTPLDDQNWNTFNDTFDPSNYLLTQKLPLPSECNKCLCKLKRKGMFAADSPGNGSSSDDSPLMESADPLVQENQVLLPPKKLETSVDSLPTVSRAQRDEEDAEFEVQPLMSPNGCECNCHSRPGHHFLSAVDPNASSSSAMQDSILSASSDISPASSRVIDSSSSVSLEDQQEAD